jgi:uncharacterized protein
MKNPIYKIIVVLISVLLFGTLIVNAQDTGTAMMNTISVVGTGTATGAPDMATISIGVERVNSEIASAYSEVNDNVASVIQALQDAGVAQEDIRTQNLNIFSELTPSPEDPNTNQINYRVSNQVFVTVRDIKQVDTIIDAAVNAGANTLYGFNQTLSDPTALEQTARANALDQAQNRAQQIADHLGVQLGDVILVSEGGFASPLGLETMDMRATGGAVIEPGQLTVSVTVQVVYAINRSE